MGQLAKTLSDEQEYLIHDVMLSYYTGQHRSIATALDADSRISSTTFYRWRTEHPSEFTAAVFRARQEAREQRADAELSLSSAALQDSMMVQARTREILTSSLDELEFMIRNRYEEIELTKPNGEKEIRHIVHYPRDRLGALKLVWEISREGTISEAVKLATQLKEGDIVQQIEDPDARLPLPRNLPSTFQSAVLVTRTGERYEFTAAVKEDDNIIDMEEDSPHVHNL